MPKSFLPYQRVRIHFSQQLQKDAKKFVALNFPDISNLKLLCKSRDLKIWNTIIFSTVSKSLNASATSESILADSFLKVS